MSGARHGRRFQTGGREIGRQGKIARGGAEGLALGAVNASPGCLTQTISMALEAANGRDRRLNANKETCICPEADKAVWQIAYGIAAYLEAAPRGAFTVEQPGGSALQHHAAIAIKHLENTRALNITPAEVRVCLYVYGHRCQWQKSALVWANPGLLGATRPARTTARVHIYMHCGRELRT